MPLPTRARRWLRPRPIEALATAVFTALVAWPYLSLTQYVTSYDTVTYSGPILSFLFREVRDGQIPQWNDQLFAGVPFIANTQTAALYPPKLPFLWLEPSRALDLITGMHLLLLGAGMYVLLAVALRLRPPAAFVGTAALVGSGLVMVRSMQFEQIAVIAWVPWVLAGVELTVRSPRWRGRTAVAVAVPTALLFLAGHPQQMYTAVPLIVAWALARALDHGPSWRARAALVGRVAVGGGLGVFLAMPQLVTSALQLSSLANSERTLETPSTTGYVLARNRVPLALLGNPIDPQPLDAGGAFEATSFVGAAVLTLAAIGAVGMLWTRRHRFTALALVALTGFSVLVATGPMCTFGNPATDACGKTGVVYRFLFSHLPGFSQARVPARWLLLAVMASAIFAAFAVDGIARRTGARRPLAAAGAGVLAALGALSIAGADWSAAETVKSTTVLFWVVAGAATFAVAALATRTDAPDRSSAPAWRDRALRALVLLPAAAVALELAIPALHSTPRAALIDRGFDQSATEIDRFLRDQPHRVFSMAAQPLGDFPYLARALRPNTNAIEDVRSIDGYDGGMWLRRTWVDAMEPFTTDGFNIDLPASWQAAAPNPSLLARFGVKYLLIDVASIQRNHAIADPGSPAAKAKARAIGAAGFTGPVLVDGDLELFENPSFRAEGRVVFRTREVDGASPGWSRTLGNLPLDDALMVSGTPGTRLTCEGPCAAVPVDLRRDRAGRIDAAVSAPQAGVLVVPEQAAAGWLALVDGREVPVQTVDAMSIGVPVTAGDHRVELRYRAPGFRLGVALFALALVGLAVCWWEPWARRRATPSPPSPGP